MVQWQDLTTVASGLKQRKSVREGERERGNQERIYIIWAQGKPCDQSVE